MLQVTIELHGADLAATPSTNASRGEPAPRDEDQLVLLTRERTDGTALPLAPPADYPALADRLRTAFISARFGAW
jgi:hypothetical protein